MFQTVSICARDEYLCLEDHDTPGDVPGDNLIALVDPTCIPEFQICDGHKQCPSGKLRVL